MESLSCRRPTWSLRSPVGVVPPAGERAPRRRAATPMAVRAVVESLERRSLLSSTSLWSPSTLPANPDVNDPNSVEVGVRFRSDGDGNITGIRFYKGAVDNPADPAHDIYTTNLWTADGTLLGTATFQNPTATGWQQANFSSPVHITAGTTYVASYFAPHGNYADTNGYFATSGYDNAPLHALKDGVGGGNGIFLYTSAPGFPGQTFSSTNYWVDVVYDDTGVTPKVSSVGQTADGHVGITFSKVMNPSTISSSTVGLYDASNVPIPVVISYDAVTGQATLTPSAPLATNTDYAVRVTTGPRDSTGLALATAFRSTFHTAALAAGGSLWDNSTIPANADFGDPNPVELGVRFQSTESGRGDEHPLL